MLVKRADRDFLFVKIANISKIMEALKKNHKKIISLKQAKNLVIVLIIIFLFNFLFFAMPILATETNDTANISDKNNITAVLNNDELKNNTANVKIKKVNYHLVTAYNSEPAQTDDSPCITANGFDLCEHGIEDSIAANFLPFGAKVRMPEIFGEKIFVVRDRMNARHKNKIDVWMLEKQDAKQFGVKLAKIEILE